MLACDEKATLGGVVKIRVTVGADGKVSSASHDSKDAALGDCVVAAFKTATFAKTASGGSFSYPFVFSTPSDATAIPPVQAGPPANPKPPVDGLDRAMISDGIAKVRPKVMACAKKSKSGGTVRVRVAVQPDGKVATATTDGSNANPVLATCVAAAVKTATFGTSGTGGMFSYPFVFGAADIASNAPKNDPTASPAKIALDRALISAAIAKVKTKVTDCGTKFPLGGTLKIRVVVGPDGAVQTADLGTAAAPKDPSNELEKCVVDVMKTATFAPTTNGGSFTYPFVFGPPKKVPPPVGGASTVSAPGSDEALDRAGISDGIAKVKAQVTACGTTTKVTGKVKIKVTVAPAGTVSAATVESTPDPALGLCVAKAIQSATFKATKTGGSFSYPFVF